MRLTGLTGPYFPTGNRGLGLDEGSRIETRAQRGQALSLMAFSWSSSCQGFRFQRSSCLPSIPS